MEQHELDLPKYIPTPEELAGDSWMYCYGQPVVIPPPPLEEEDDGHSQ
jgi:hypothetical protein